MKCIIEECEKHQDCGFLEITKKIPISKDKCSWFKRMDARKKQKHCKSVSRTESGSCQREDQSVFS